MPMKTPLQTGNFAVEIDGVVIGFFKEISGLGIEMNVATDKLMGAEMKMFEPKLPAGQAVKDLTLKRGVTQDMALYDWFDLVLKGSQSAAEKTIGIKVCDQDMGILAEFGLTGCFPTKLTQGDLNAAGKEMLVEELSIVYDNLLWTT
jgi:phage tail-like protein